MRFIRNFVVLLVAVILVAALPVLGEASAQAAGTPAPDMCGPYSGGPCIIADFIASPTTGYAPLRVQFLDTSSGRPSNWEWDFGDGTTATAIADPVHVYTKPGRYTVTLVASSTTAGTSTKVKEAYIIVRDPTPIYADFVASPTSGKAPLEVQFSDCTIGNPTHWFWDFGDGFTDTVQNPVHVYRKPGYYTVKLTASNELGGSSTKIKEKYIRVDGACEIIADFVFTPETGRAPLTVQFTDTSSGDPTQWLWDFGDGPVPMDIDASCTGDGCSNSQNPVHTYTEPGTYTIRLIASSEMCTAGTKEKTITVLPACDIRADFIAVPEKGTAPLTVQFMDKSTGNPTQWLWDFGDGPIPMDIDASCTGDGCSNVANPRHTYLEPGTYTVTLTASDQYGCSDTVTKKEFVVVVPACDIDADFIATPQEGTAPLKVQFTDTSTGHPTMWQWDFGDGSMPMETCSGDGCGNVANPVHTYLEPGTYTVTLTASNQYGCSDTETKRNYIVVVPACDIKADFIATPQEGTAPLTVQFTDTSTGHPTMWLWDFGDGPIPMDTDASCTGDGCSNVANPRHTYLEPGTYTVTLTVSDQYGCSDTVTKKEFVVVVPACDIDADFIATPQEGPAPLRVQFTDTSTGHPTMWKWDFGDGSMPMEMCSGDGCDNVANPVHTYLDPGTYTVTLTASNQYGCSDTETKRNYIVVVPACDIDADFIATPQEGPAPLRVQFTDTSTGHPTMWKWDFGDGSMPMEMCSGDGCDNVANPVHTYLDPGTYTVTLTASNQYGCSDTETKRNYIVVVPACDIKADFIATPQEGSAPLKVQFTDKSTGGATMWKWDFGDGSMPMEMCSGDGCDNVANPVHTYLDPGTYTVTLTASNQYGCSDTETKRNYIVVVPACDIKADFIATPREGIAPLRVQFTDKSTGGATMWKWDFGDGAMPMELCEGSGCNNVANPYHTYLDPGTYTVTLTASNQYGCSDTETKTGFITVGAEPTEYIPVSTGWNFVSVPRKLAPGSDTASILSGIDVKGHSIFQYDAYTKVWNIMNSASPIRPLDAFWIYSAREDRIPLTFDTNPVQAPPTKNLKKGWNGIGFTGLTPIEAKYTLLSVQNQWVNCIGFNAGAQHYNAMIIKGSNDNTMMEPYMGYWIYVKADGILAANAA